MALISLQDLSIGFGGPPLLDGVSLQIEEGERVCLLGQNGAGKSTLMKLILGDLAPDGGRITRMQSLRVSWLSQVIPSELSGTVLDVISSGLEEESREGQRLVKKLLSHMKLDGGAPCSSLSAGIKRRVLLARGLASGPHILLLDEPTNHLDVDSVTWLEEFLLRYGGTLLFVTHDRLFLQKLATRIVELDRGRLINWACDYPTYLIRKEALLETETAQNVLFDKKLAEEESWIRQGIKARRTRNEGRVRTLNKMRKEFRMRREQTGNIRAALHDAGRSGRLVIEAEGVSFGYGGDMVVKEFSTLILRGDKVGIIGPNGAGKTTLLKGLLGDIPPVEGKVMLGTRLEIAYFDQLRAQLDEQKSVQENVAEGNDTVTINGKPRHITGYLQDFLFSPDRARSPVKILSGGERNRLLLAKLFTKPSNMMIMDEPTNDLDMETLELLEKLLVDYRGTLLLVSHDRAFLNNVVTSTIVFEGQGKVQEYAGGYDDWLMQRRKQVKEAYKKEGVPTRSKERARKLTFREQKELDELPGKIEAFEENRDDLYRRMAEPGTYQKGKEAVTNLQSEIDKIEKILTEDYARWEELEEVKDALKGKVG